MSIQRTDKSIIGQWWWTIDRWALAALGMLILFGVMLVSAASPAIALKNGDGHFYYVIKHLIFLGISVGAMLFISGFTRKWIWRTGTILLIGSLVMILATLFFGTEIKGSSRWIYLFGFSLQPSEFLKPAFAVSTAWILSYGDEQDRHRNFLISMGLFACAIILLIAQPDFGMSFVIGIIWFTQIILAGLSLRAIAFLSCMGGAGIYAAYRFLPHVTSRINRFFDPASGDNYQVEKALQSFEEGGVFGTGLAQGNIKTRLPDAHADFIFAVAGEELGLLVTIFLICLFAFFVMRCILRIQNSNDLFVILAVGGLISQFAVQSLIHMGSSVNLLPAKGMTLPFISYGGSSLVALGIGCGYILALTRRRISATMPVKQNKQNTQAENKHV